MPYAVDVTGREPPTRVFVLRGLVATGIVAVVVALLLAQYRGGFRADFPATAVVADVGDGIRRGADVKLRGVLVGHVAQVRTDGVQRLVDLRLDPGYAPGIPAGVRARVLPLNLFGVAALELVEPPDAAPGGSLARAARIPGDDSAETVRLQSILDRITDILRSVRPAELATVLSTLSQAMSGRGARIGETIGRLDGYLTTLTGRSEDFSADLALLADTLEGLADAAPALLDTVENAVVTTATLVAQRERLAATLAGAHTATGDLDGLLADNEDRVIRVARSSAAVLRTIAEDRDDIPRSLRNLGLGADALSTALGPDGGGLSLTLSAAPFAPYTPADCPRYGELAGPNCAAGPSGPGGGSGPGGTVGPVGGDAEERDLAELTGPGMGDAGALLLGPIVRGTQVAPR
jgi:virulence factor Mce-like protein